MEKIARFKVGNNIFRDLIEKAQASDQKFRPDFVLTFSANNNGEIWNFATWGSTPPDRRYFIDDAFLRDVVRELAVIKPELGRFHMDNYGAYWGTEKRVKNQFIQFEKLASGRDEYQVNVSLKPTNSEILRLKLKGKL